jgi:hypothetical protein
VVSWPARITGSSLEQRKQTAAPTASTPPPSPGPLWTRRDLAPAATGTTPKQPTRARSSASGSALAGATSATGRVASARRVGSLCNHCCLKSPMVPIGAGTRATPTSPWERPAQPLPSHQAGHLRPLPTGSLIRPIAKVTSATVGGSQKRFARAGLGSRTTAISGESHRTVGSSSSVQRGRSFNRPCRAGWWTRRSVRSLAVSFELHARIVPLSEVYAGVL